KPDSVPCVLANNAEDDPKNDQSVKQIVEDSSEKSPAASTEEGRDTSVPVLSSDFDCLSIHEDILIHEETVGKDRDQVNLVSPDTTNDHSKSACDGSPTLSVKQYREKRGLEDSLEFEVKKLKCDMELVLKRSGRIEDQLDSIQNLMTKMEGNLSLAQVGGGSNNGGNVGKGSVGTVEKGDMEVKNPIIMPSTATLASSI
ncbi:hypothetical protein MP638_003059, partial [Amoeboaphelidium occidentale]